jgi:hypothetical protein
MPGPDAGVENKRIIWKMPELKVLQIKNKIERESK